MLPSVEHPDARVFADGIANTCHRGVGTATADATCVGVSGTVQVPMPPLASVSEEAVVVVSLDRTD